MTAQELRNYFNETYGIDKEWPRTYEVDHETYANCCQAIIDSKVENSRIDQYDNTIVIAIGYHQGLMFKNVELILKK